MMRLNIQGYLLKRVIKTGMIIPFGGSSAPEGFLICTGGEVSRTTYADLFSVIGTTYGAGDGSTTFNLPNFRPRKTTSTTLGVRGTGKAVGFVGNSSLNDGGYLALLSENNVGFVPASSSIIPSVGTATTSGAYTLVNKFWGISPSATYSGMIAEDNTIEYGYYCIKY